MPNPVIVGSIQQSTTSPANSLALSAYPTVSGGILDGDLIECLLFLNRNGGSQVPDLLARWQRVDNFSESTNSNGARYVRMKSSGDDILTNLPTFTWTGTACNATVAVIVVRGAPRNVQFDGNGSTTSGSGGPTSNSMTPANANGLFIFASSARGTGPVAQTPPSGFTEVLDGGSNTGTADISCSVSYLNLGAAGATGQKTATGYSGSSIILAHVIKADDGGTTQWSATGEVGPGNETQEFGQINLNGTGASSAYDATAALDGSYGHRGVITGGGSHRATVQRGLGLNAERHLWISWKFRVPSHSGTGNAWFQQYRPSSGNPVLRIGFISSTAVMRVTRKDGSNVDTAITGGLTTGTIYSARLHVDYRGANPVWTLYLGGTQVATYTDTSTGTLNDPATGYWGPEETTATKAMEVHSDTWQAGVNDPGAATAPGAPTSIVPTAGNKKIGMTWASPSTDGGSAVTGFEVWLDNGTHVALASNVFSFEWTGLTNGQSYVPHVAAVNAIGTGTTGNGASTTPARVQVNTWWHGQGGNHRRDNFTTQGTPLPHVFLGSAAGPDDLATDDQWYLNDGNDVKPQQIPNDCHLCWGPDNIILQTRGQGMVAYEIDLTKPTTVDVKWTLPWKGCVSAPSYFPGKTGVNVENTAGKGAFCVGQLDGWFSRIPYDGNNDNVRSYWAGSAIRKSICVVDQYALIVTENGSLHKVNLADPAGTYGSGAFLAAAWTYDGGASAGKAAQTPPSYSAKYDRVVYATADGYVHCVNFTTGAVVSRRKPSGHTWNVVQGSDALRNTAVTFEDGYIVIADEKGYAFVAINLNFDYIDNSPAGNSNAYPTGAFATQSAVIQSWLDANPLNKSVFCLDLADGQNLAEPLTMAIGFATTEDYKNGTQRPDMGGMPCVAINVDGSEVVYARHRNNTDNADATTHSPDWRWDKLLGEYVLDSVTRSGYVAGQARGVKMGTRFNGGVGDMHIVDEDCQVMVSGDYIWYTHWASTSIARITDRDTAGIGDTMANPIATSVVDSIVWNKLKVAGDTGINLANRSSASSGTAARDRVYDGRCRFCYYNAKMGAGYGPPEIAATGQPQAFSCGKTARMTAVHKQFFAHTGNDGHVCVYRHGGYVAHPTPTRITRTVIDKDPIPLAPVGLRSKPIRFGLYPADAVPASTITATLTDGGQGGTFRDMAGNVVTQLTFTNSSTYPILAHFVTWEAPVGAAGQAVLISCTNGSGLENP